MIERTLDAGVVAAWAVGDEVCGDNPHPRAALERRQLGYVLAVSSTHRVPTPAGGQRTDHLAKKIPKRAWQKLSAGRGAKGHRWYDWAQIAITAPGLAGHQHLLIRRDRRTGELAYYRCCAPRPVPLSTLVKVAGSRWTVEETFQSRRPWPGRTSTGSAAGTPGAAGSLWPCSPTPSSRSRPPANAATRPWPTTGPARTG
ncbi:hypothetical protein GCM10019016_104470 [Streptomyces prasinosporus]|uniref:Transposase IS701-like DDE domain-containing protein n=1 Tax=Streptomyces prasinosporus TaxID=68256 RepID=A0ABP6U9H2_9ACTN